MRRATTLAPLAAALALTLAACGTTTAQTKKSSPDRGTTPATPAASASPAASILPYRKTELPTSVQQGAMIVGITDPGAGVRYGDRSLRVSPNGRFVFSVGRDATGSVTVVVNEPVAGKKQYTVEILPRDWPIETIDGVPPDTVNPPPEIAARIAREQSSVAAVRTRDDAREDFAQPFIWPVQGRISGRFGNQRVYNGTPKSPHSGMDIAAANGTPVKAPAAGIVTFASPSLYLTGGTVVIDHGAGISSNFLHLSRIDVKVGDRVEQGQVFGAVGATGRATGPHLHWGMNWFDARIDPLLVLELAK
ncbi:MAG: M23 family metallopeptidase [Lysobacter sp.]|nr:M23 family metallopeptidase [Lysobacter sp.]